MKIVKPRFLYAPDESDAQTILNDDDTVTLPYDGEVEEPSEEPDDSQETADDGDIDGKPEGKPREEKGVQDVTYKGKSREEVIQMHQNATQELQRLQSDKSSRVNTVKEAQQTLSDIENNMSSEDLKGALTLAKRQMYQIDPTLDPEAYEIMADIVSQVEATLSTKRIDEKFSSSENQKKNESFSKAYLKGLENNGFSLKESEAKNLTNAASQYLESGLLTEKAYRKAMFDVYPLEAVDKFYFVKAETKTRNDISKASGKVDDLVTVSKGKGSGRKIPRGELTPAQARQAVRSMSKEELERL